MSEVMVVPPFKSLVIPYRQDVASMVPAARVFDYKGSPHLLVPHGVDETKFLRNLGIKAPSPVSAYYQFTGTPFPSQEITAARLALMPRGYLLSDMGVGKTRATLYALDYLIGAGIVRKVLIVSPLSTLSTVWERELFTLFPQYTAAVLHGPKKKRLVELARDVDFYIINHHGPGVLKDDLVARTDIDAVVVDEVATFRKRNTDLWRNLNVVLKGRKYVWGLTGSPTPQAPTDAFGIAKLITPGTVPKTFTEFRNMTMLQVSQFKWVPQRNAADVVFDVLRPAIRYTREQVLPQLPKTTVTYRTIKMGTTQVRAYDRMFKDLRVQWLSGDITAANEAVKAMKLVQIAIGVAYDDAGNSVTFNNTDREKELCNICDQTTRKILAFVPYKNIIPKVSAALTKHGVTHEVMTGETSKRDRDIIIGHFRNHADPRLILAHPGTMAHGLTLVEADTIVWIGPITSAEIYDQANARVTRPGQKYNTHIIHLMGCDVEKRMYARLVQRLNMQGVLLDMFKAATQGSFP